MIENAEVSKKSWGISHAWCNLAIIKLGPIPTILGYLFLKYPDWTEPIRNPLGLLSINPLATVIALVREY